MSILSLVRLEYPFQLVWRSLPNTHKENRFVSASFYKYLRWQTKGAKHRETETQTNTTKQNTHTQKGESAQVCVRSC